LKQMPQKRTIKRKRSPSPSTYAAAAAAAAASAATSADNARYSEFLAEDAAAVLHANLPPANASKKMRRERQHPSKPKEEGTNKTEGSSEMKEEVKKDDYKNVIWNDRNCDHDLDDHAASNVHTRKIKISSNLLLSCKMISHLENKHLQQDYAALVFSRKTNKEKSFDFMIDLRVTERLIRGLQIIIDENPVFFNKRTNLNKSN